jgi:hypothetical protein
MLGRRAHRKRFRRRRLLLVRPPFRAIAKTDVAEARGADG